jgi:hypothetical protein
MIIGTTLSYVRENPFEVFGVLILREHLCLLFKAAACGRMFKVDECLRLNHVHLCVHCVIVYSFFLLFYFT